MVPEGVRQAARSLGSLLRRKGTSPELGKALRRAVRDLDSVLMGKSETEQATALESAIRELRSCIALIQASNRPADRDQLEGTSEALALIAPLAEVAPVAPSSLTDQELVVPLPQAPGATQAPQAPQPPPQAPQPLPAPSSSIQDEAILWEIVEEHLDEAEFLFERWLVAARSPRFSLVEIQKTVERRLTAHLDGLIVGGSSVADRLLWPALDKDAGAPVLRVAAAASALLMDSAPSIRDRLIDLFRGATTDALRGGLCCAFQITGRGDVDEPLRLALRAAKSPAAQSDLLAVLASRRLDPGPILETLLASPDAGVLRAALNAAPAAERHRYRHLVEGHLSHDVPGIRAAALRTGLIWNLKSAWQSCDADARAGLPEGMLLLSLLGGPEGVPLITSALRTTERRKAALFALGFTGYVEAVDACLPLLDDSDPSVTRLAVEAVASITGLPLYEKPFVLPPDDEPNGDLPPLEDDLRVDLMPAPHDDIPRPDAAKVREWWSERRQSLASDRRYLRGVPLSSASLQAALEEGPLRRSGPLACEIAIRSGGRVQLPALRLAYPTPVVPAEVAFHRRPAWL